MGVILCLKE